MEALSIIHPPWLQQEPKAKKDVGVFFAVLSWHCLLKADFLFSSLPSFTVLTSVLSNS